MEEKRKALKERAVWWPLFGDGQGGNEWCFVGVRGGQRAGPLGPVSDRDGPSFYGSPVPIESE